MNRRVLAVVALAGLLLLAGCSSYLSDAGGENPNDAMSTISPGGAATTPAATGTPAEANPTESTPTDADVDATPTDSGTDTAAGTSGTWSPPPEPNMPLEKALNGSQGNRITALEHVGDGIGAATGDVTLAVRANTSMAKVDPANMGTVRGEPFFLVYVNGSLHPGGEWAGSQFYRVEGTRAVNTEQVGQHDDGTFELTVPAGAFDAEGAAGEVDVMVLLLDQDKQWDDVYGVANVTIDYELPPEHSDGTPTDDGSSTGDEAETDDESTTTAESPPSEG